MIELMLEVIFENILFPNMVNKKRSPFLRFFLAVFIFVMFFGLSSLFLWAGIGMLIDDFQENKFQGILLVLCGVLTIWYFIYHVRNVIQKARCYKG